MSIKIAKYKEKNFKYILSEMRKHNYDAIRFATYRTASKIRFMQKYYYLNLIDLDNVIEALRPLTSSYHDNYIASKPDYQELTIHDLRDIVLLGLYQSLNRRLVPQAQLQSISSVIDNLTSWLAAVYDNENSGNLRLFSVQIALAILCSGKYINKIKFIFSLINDQNGHLIMEKYLDFCKEATMLPASLYETASVGFSEPSALALFDNKTNIGLEEFLRVHLNYPGPYYLIWLSLVNRMAAAENVIHDVPCTVCDVRRIVGFRYECQNCPGQVTLCQDCFWRGNIAADHTLEHEMKEFSSYKPNRTHFPTYRPQRSSSKCIPSYLLANGERKGSENSTFEKKMGDSVLNLSIDYSSSLHDKSSLSQHNDTSSSNIYSSLQDVRSLNAEENAAMEHKLITNLLNILSIKNGGSFNGCGSKQQSLSKSSSAVPRDMVLGENGKPKNLTKEREYKSRKAALIKYLEQRNKDIALEIQSLQLAKIERENKLQEMREGDYYQPYSNRTLPNPNRVRRNLDQKSSNFLTNSPNESQAPKQLLNRDDSFAHSSESGRLGENFMLEHHASNPNYARSRNDYKKSSYQELRALRSKKDELESRMDDLYRERVRLASQLHNIMGVLGDNSNDNPQDNNSENNHDPVYAVPKYYHTSNRLPDTQINRAHFYDFSNPSPPPPATFDRDHFYSYENDDRHSQHLPLPRSSLGLSLPEFFGGGQGVSLLPLKMSTVRAGETFYDSQLEPGPRYSTNNPFLVRSNDPQEGHSRYYDDAQHRYGETIASKDDPFVVRDHLLMAADSVTNAMSDLVNELNSSEEDEPSYDNETSGPYYRSSSQFNHSTSSTCNPCIPKLRCLTKGKIHSTSMGEMDRSKTCPEYEEYLEQILEN